MTSAAESLIAEPRTFSTVAGALLWYAAELARRSSVHAVPLERGPAGHAEHRARKEATFAAVSLCLVRHAPEDGSGPGLTRRRLAAVFAWLESFGEDPALARLRSVAWKDYERHTRRCQRTVRLIGRRMRARGLIA